MQSMFAEVRRKRLDQYLTIEYEFHPCVVSGPKLLDSF